MTSLLRLTRSSLLLLAVLLVLSCIALPTLATSPPTSATLISTGVSSLGWSIRLPTGEATAEQLQVFVQPESGNARDDVFPVTVTAPGPMSIDITSLRPGTLYTFRFSLVSSVNGTSAALVSSSARTTALGPQILSAYAVDPSDAGDAGFSAGDQITLSFDSDTNKPAVGSADAINSIFSFSSSIGSEYSGNWVSSRKLVITISSPGDASPILGSLLVTVIGDLRSSDGRSAASTSVSPPLTGSWGALRTSTRFLRPTAILTNTVIDATEPTSYNLRSLPGEVVRIPLTLAVPSSRTNGYVLFASVTYPTEASGFILTGTEFAASPSTMAIGPTTSSLSTWDLLQALRTLTITPPSATFQGDVCVSVKLVDITTAASGGPAGLQNPPMATVYMTIRFTDGLVTVPSNNEESGGGGVFEKIKSNKLGLIIGLCAVIGVVILVGLGIFCYRRRRDSSDGRDFEAKSLREGEAPPPMGEAGPTRRFYYDAKV